MKLKPTISSDVTIIAFKILSINRFCVVYHRSQNLFMLRFVFNLRSFTGYYNNNKHNVLIKFDCTKFFFCAYYFACDPFVIRSHSHFWISTFLGYCGCFLCIFYSKQNVWPDRMFLINFPLKIFINCSSIFHDDAREEFSILDVIIY